MAVLYTYNQIYSALSVSNRQKQDVYRSLIFRNSSIIVFNFGMRTEIHYKLYVNSSFVYRHVNDLVLIQ